MDPLFDQARSPIGIDVISHKGSGILSLILILWDGRKEVEVADQPLRESERLRVVSMALTLDN